MQAAEVFDLFYMHPFMSLLFVYLFCLAILKYLPSALDLALLLCGGKEHAYELMCTNHWMYGWGTGIFTLLGAVACMTWRYSGWE